jgi:hypothetical protein
MLSFGKSRGVTLVVKIEGKGRKVLRVLTYATCETSETRGLQLWCALNTHRWLKIMQQKKLLTHHKRGVC